jgi:thiol-disulfide isomerase/thioredoxin
MRTASARIFFILTAMASVGVLPFSSLGDEPVRVNRLKLDQMDQMIHHPSSQCLVVFLAAWCLPCIKELPDLNKIYLKYEAQGFKMVGFSLDLEGPQAIQPIVTKHRIRFPVYWVGEAAIEKYQIKGIPLLWFVRNGQVVETLKGKRPYKLLEAKIRDFLDPDDS